VREFGVGPVVGVAHMGDDGEYARNAAFRGVSDHCACVLSPPPSWLIGFHTFLFMWFQVQLETFVIRFSIRDSVAEQKSNEQRKEDSGAPSFVMMRGAPDPRIFILLHLVFSLSAVTGLSSINLCVRDLFFV